MIRAVLFDLFGTVVAYDHVEVGTRLGWEEIRQSVAALGREIEYDAFAPLWNGQFQHPLAPHERSGETPFVDKILRFYADYDLARDVDRARQAAHDCLSHWAKHIALPDDVLPTLEALRPAYKLGLVSNFDHPPFVHSLLKDLALDVAFDSGVISGDILWDKPDPRIFQMVLDALECAPSEAIFVGDNLRTDIGGAEAAGMMPVLIDRDERNVDYGGYRILDMAELPEMLANIQAGLR